MKTMKTMTKFICSTWSVLRNNYFLLLSKKVVEIDYTTKSNINNHIFFQMFNNDFRRRLKELRKSSNIDSITINFKVKLK